MRSVFLRGVATPQFYQGLRDNCLYSGAVHIATKASFILSVQSEDEAVTVLDAQVNDPGQMDEYQQSCVAQWLTGVRVALPGVAPGSRYRVVMEVAM